MRGPSKSSTTHSSPPPLLHTLEVMRRAGLNRVFALVYTCGILALLYHHSLALLHSTTLLSFSLTLSLLLSDAVLAFMWSTTQSCRMRPIRRRAFPENLTRVVNESQFPAMDVFVCTADPFKEPPMSVVNTALSVMAYDYPPEKMSVYVSDDGGSELTLFAFMEAAKFAAHWLPFCRMNRIEERCPDAYFGSNQAGVFEAEKLKMMYESMKEKVESVVERGYVGEECITTEHEREAFNKWTIGFTRQDHPTVIQVILESGQDKDVLGHEMPNLVYLSRQKSRTSPHHFKAGALNALLRVSATMTNAPVVLTLDCDMYSNDPQTPLQVLCYLLDPSSASKLGYVQFPQRFYGINKNDIYAGEYTRLVHVNSMGMDGFTCMNYIGSGCFFRRRAFFGGPSTLVSSEIPELNPDYVVNKSIRSQAVLKLAHHVASCNYESHTKWGSKMGFRYGSLVEDYNTGYRLQCEGWRSVFCNPDRAAFFGATPINLNDVLNQTKRWSIGLLEVGLSKYSPVTFGTWYMGPLVGLSYSNYALWGIWSIPITTYAFLPQLALLNGVSIFPKVSNPWFYLYVFLFLGAYGQDCLEFFLVGRAVQRWWNDQRMWMIRGVSSYLFGFINYVMDSFGISVHGFNVTSKVVDDEQSKRYHQGIFEFGVPSPLFVPLVMTAIINLMSFLVGLMGVIRYRNMEERFVQLFLSGFVMVNCWPIYEAMVLRTDKGRMPMKTTKISILLTLALYLVASLPITIWN
ncbi:hypothetical protein HHK36_027489 [Tetracentron sinense]|uniref:Cellulose synthase-like protein G3 n=1 Tax=Tetracentron sinense TaxID=13715 RepID=A0A835D1M0_TETSI|nr:hypothetical protein HHK36_027489 [Tetracentron sinense]